MAVTRKPAQAQPDSSGQHDDEAMLAELGYKQELHRRMSGFANFAVSFSVISILAGCITTRTWPWTPEVRGPSASAG